MIMGRKCCVPNCKSNYGGTKPYTNCFTFQKNETKRQLWINLINRADFVPNTTTVVCLLHFEDRFIIREDSAVRDDGSLLVVPRKYPKLSPDAYPTVFPYNPSEPTPKSHRKPRKKKSEHNVTTPENNNLADMDRIASFAVFQNSYRSKISNDWLSVEDSKFVLIYKLDLVGCPRVTVSVKVHNDLSVHIWLDGASVDVPESWNLLQENKCYFWSRFESLVNHIDLMSENGTSLKMKLESAIDALTRYKFSLEKEECDMTSDRVRELLEEVAHSLQTPTSNVPIITNVFTQLDSETKNKNGVKPKGRKPANKKPSNNKPSTRKRKRKDESKDDDEVELEIPLTKIKIEPDDYSYNHTNEDDDVIFPEIDMVKVEQHITNPPLVMLKRYVPVTGDNDQTQPSTLYHNNCSSSNSSHNPVILSASNGSFGTGTVIRVTSLSPVTDTSSDNDESEDDE